MLFLVHVHYIYIDHQAVDVWNIGPNLTSLICLTSPSSYNSMQSLHDLSHLEVLVYTHFAVIPSLYLAGSAEALCCLTYYTNN